MKVSVEKLPNSEAVLEIDLSWDELEKASDKAYRKLVQKVDVQGFRRGKAPRSLLERKLGKEYIYQEGLDDLISESYRSALTEHELTPITQPELDAPVFEMGQPYHFSLKVPILTPVELGDYASLHFEREEADVTSEEVEQELETLRNRQATWHAVGGQGEPKDARPAAYNDRVTVDLKLTVEDKSISDLKDNPFELTQERHGLFTGMDEHIVGMRPSESKAFTTVIPDDYSNENIAGKEAHYAVTLYKVEAKEMPELDDAFALAATEGQVQTLEDLRKSVSDNILEVKERRVRDELREKVMNAVIDQSQFTIHPLLIQEEAEEMLHQLGHMLEQQHMSIDQYLMMVRKTREEYLKDIEPDAARRVKRQLVLDEVARKENIGVLPEEVEALFRAYAQAGQQLERSDAQIRAMVISYRREKALTRLLELTTDPDPETTGAEEEDLPIASAQEAALAGDTLVADIEAQAQAQAQAQAGQQAFATGESAAPIASDTDTDVVE